MSAPVSVSGSYALANRHGHIVGGPPRALELVWHKVL